MVLLSYQHSSRTCVCRDEFPSRLLTIPSSFIIKWRHFFSPFKCVYFPQSPRPTREMILFPLGHSSDRPVHSRGNYIISGRVKIMLISTHLIAEWHREQLRITVEYAIFRRGRTRWWFNAVVAAARYNLSSEWPFSYWATRRFTHLQHPEHFSLELRNFTSSSVAAAEPQQTPAAWRWRRGIERPSLFTRPPIRVSSSAPADADGLVADQVEQSLVPKWLCGYNSVRQRQESCERTPGVLEEEEKCVGCSFVFVQIIDLTKNWIYGGKFSSHEKP